MEVRLHVEELVHLFLRDGLQGNAGPPRDHFLDVGARHVEDPVRLVLVALLELLVPSPERDLLVVVGHRLVEVLPRQGVFHALDGASQVLFDLLDLTVGDTLAELDPGPGFVKDGDRLVGKEAIGDVAVRLVHGGADRLAVEPDPMETLVALLDALQNGHGLDLVRWTDRDGLEAPDQGAVLLDVLVIVARRRRADALHLAPRQRRLEDVRGVERSLGGAGADQGVDLVDEDHHVVGRGQLGDDPLQPLLELAAILGARHDQGQIERQDPLVQQRRRDLAVDDPRGEAFDDRGLADTRLSEEDRVVLAAAREDLDHPLELDLSADQRIEDPTLCHLGQIAGELVQERRFLLFLGESAALVDIDRVLAYREQAHAPLPEHAAGDGVLEPQEAQEEVLRSDVRVHQPLGFFLGELEGLFRLLAERDLDGRGELFARWVPPFELRLQEVHGDVRAGEQLARGFLSFFQEAQQDVLGPDDLAPLLTRFVARQEENAFGLFGEFLEHRLPRAGRSRILF